MVLSKTRKGLFLSQGSVFINYSQKYSLSFSPDSFANLKVIPGVLLSNVFSEYRKI